MELAKHFVLIHGACMGAWCWYKLKPMLEKSGYKVTALDMAACGINMKSIDELDTIHDYTKPLLEFLATISQEEKVILVGHSLGGLNISVAAELFPEKIALAVFLTAFMPDTTHQPSYVIDQYSALGGSKEGWLDTQFTPRGNDPKESFTQVSFGPKFFSMACELSPVETLQLGMMLARPSSLFLHDLLRMNKFSDQGYGSIRRVFIICKRDKAISEEFQRWMIENAGTHEVKELDEADHAPMFSVPQDLHDCLVEIADISA